MSRPGVVFGAIALLAGAGGVCAGIGSAGLVFNHSNSLPVGVWRVGQEPVRRGSVVLVCPPNGPVFQGAMHAQYIAPGSCEGGFAPLLKPVAAMAGDRVEVSDVGIRVNGSLIVNSGLKRVDGAGRLLPRHQIGSHVVKPGEVWLVSDYNPYSFDSRYFGPVDMTRIRGVAHPVRVRAG